jgi:predicted amidohydrolase YtcJ
MDENKPFATSAVIKNDSILAIGEESDCRKFFNSETFEDLQGYTIIPGLTDAHIHLQHYALGLKYIDCEVATLKECMQRVAKRIDHLPHGRWAIGHGWNQNDWAEGFGSAVDLDVISPYNPVYLTAKSLHAGWANTAALQAANININTMDPPDGHIQRDEQGHPTGILFEGAMRLIAEVIPQESIAEIADAIKHAQKKLWQMGITSLHDFDRRDCFAALQILHTSGDLHLRVLKSLPIEDIDHAVALGLQTGFGDDWLRIGSLKVFADGALGPHTAAMLAPFEDDPNNLGMLLVDNEELFELSQKAVSNGLSLAVHAIGDRANHEVIRAFEQVRSYETQQEIPFRLRHRIEHVQLIHPDDAPKLAKLGISASMQPIHATSDMMMADKYWGRRAANAYAWQTQLQYGAKLLFGSDAPVESPNPFWGLHAAVTRQRADGFPGPQGWYPKQRLTFKQALQAYTTGPAFAAGMENRLGKLAPGYLADLLVLPEDPFRSHPTELRDITPTAVMIGGKWVIK